MSCQYLIVKRDLYYRPNSFGYTGVKSKAGRFTLEHAERICSVGDEVSFYHEDDCPAYTYACFDDIRQRDLNRRLGEIVDLCFDIKIEDLNDRLRELLRDTNMSKLERLLPKYQGGKS